MKVKKYVYNLYAAMLSLTGVLIFLFFRPIKNFAGMDVIFGYSNGEIEYIKFNIFAFSAIAIATLISIMLFLNAFGMLRKDPTTFYVIGLLISTILVFLTSILLPLGDRFEDLREFFELDTSAIISGFCLFAAVIVLIVSDILLKNKAIK